MCVHVCELDKKESLAGKLTWAVQSLVPELCRLLSHSV